MDREEARVLKDHTKAMNRLAGAMEDFVKLSKRQSASQRRGGPEGKGSVDDAYLAQFVDGGAPKMR